MSTLDEKLEARDRTIHEKARCRLSYLRERPGYRVEQLDKAGPTLVSICPMDTRTHWRRVQLEGKKDATMELDHVERDCEHP